MFFCFLKTCFFFSLIEKQYALKLICKFQNQKKSKSEMLTIRIQIEETEMREGWSRRKKFIIACSFLIIIVLSIFVGMYVVQLFIRNQSTTESTTSVVTCITTTIGTTSTMNPTATTKNPTVTTMEISATTAVATTIDTSTAYASTNISTTTAATTKTMNTSTTTMETTCIDADCIVNSLTPK